MFHFHEKPLGFLISGSVVSLPTTLLSSSGVKNVFSRFEINPIKSTQAWTNLLLSCILGPLLLDLLLFGNDPVNLDVDFEEMMDGVIQELLLRAEAIESNTKNT